MADALSYRIKEYYEDVTKFKLPRRTYTLIKLELRWGKTPKSFSDKLMEAMVDTGRYLAMVVPNAELVGIYHGEISMLLIDFKVRNNNGAFNNEIQEVGSTITSIATVKLANLIEGDEMHVFKAHVFTIPSSTEVSNYFLSRTQHCVRESILILGTETFTREGISSKHTGTIKDLCIEAGKPWEELTERNKYGAVIHKGEKRRWTTIDNYEVSDEPSLMYYGKLIYPYKIGVVKTEEVHGY
ncbi:MAG: hypothetical protein KAH32_00085 [Chlamydiia bacterium]|nr:hypothetical protein [Chlamydiia bacterium]